MPTRLSQHFKTRRLRRKLTLGSLARTLGYRDVGKGAGRIHRFETFGDVHPDLLVKLATALHIGTAVVAKLIEQDRRRFFREWLEWAKEPIRPYLVIRLLPACYRSEELPADVIGVEAAEAFAAERARQWGRPCCLVLSRPCSVWLDEQGVTYERTEAVPGQTNTPYLRLGGSGRPFLLRFGPARIIHPLSWPPPPGPEGR